MKHDHISFSIFNSLDQLSLGKNRRMPKSFENQYDLPFPWQQSALAVWHKYPNPFATHVISMDVLDQRYDAETDLLRIERVLGVQQTAPMWAVKVSLDRKTFKILSHCHKALDTTLKITNSKSNLMIDLFLLLQFPFFSFFFFGAAFRRYKRYICKRGYHDRSF